MERSPHFVPRDLSERERAHLRQLAASKENARLWADRSDAQFARCVALLRADGVPISRIAGFLGVNRGTAYRWAERGDVHLRRAGARGEADARPRRARPANPPAARDAS